MSAPLWSPREAAQVEYESLRERILQGGGPDDEGLLPSRFQRLGLLGLVTAPQVEPVRWQATVVGAQRPRWSPYVDPRVEALADVFQCLLEGRLPTSAVAAMEAAP
jgi:hypothetical protein